MQRPILQRYGATEFGAIFKMRLDDKTVPEGSVGEIASGVDVKLSEGDEGEVLVKSPVCLLIYHLRNCAKEI
jgi:malonyl-CoA/methylmalonyl-CoA synthetase